MRDHGIGALPVCDGPGVISVITDRDITIGAVAEGRDPATIPVRDCMSTGPIFCYADDEVADAGETVAQNLADLAKADLALANLPRQTKHNPSGINTARTLQGICELSG